MELKGIKKGGERETGKPLKKKWHPKNQMPQILLHYWITALLHYFKSSIFIFCEKAPAFIS